MSDYVLGKTSLSESTGIIFSLRFWFQSSFVLKMELVAEMANAIMQMESATVFLDFMDRHAIVSGLHILPSLNFPTMSLISVKFCPGDGTCSGNGVCDNMTGECLCQPKFHGNICQCKNLGQIWNDPPFCHKITNVSYKRK